MLFRARRGFCHPPARVTRYNSAKSIRVANWSEGERRGRMPASAIKIVIGPTDDAEVMRPRSRTDDLANSVLSEAVYRFRGLSQRFIYTRISSKKT